MTDSSVLNDVRKLTEEVQGLREELAKVKSLCSPFGLPMADGTILVQTALGNRYFVPANDFSMMPKLVGNRVWEPRVTSLFSSIVKPGMTVVDVGANFGYYTCLAGTIMGPTPESKVIAIEPNPEILSLLERNIYVNWSMAPVEIRDVAVGAAVGVCNLHIPKGLACQASLSRPNKGLDRSRRNPPDIETVEVMVDTLDNIIPSSETVDILKIDVEGEEVGVLAGAQGVLRRSQDVQIVMEWSRDQLENVAGRSEVLANFIVAHGFKAHHVEAKGRLISIEEMMKLELANIWLKRV